MMLKTLRLSDSDLNVSYQEAGAGEPLVLLHGVGMQSAAWTPQIEALQTTYRVIALDLPGHGASDALDANSQLPDFVAWCDAVISALDVGPVNLAGHSMGALIAGGMAVAHEHALRRVALLNGVYCRDLAARAAVIARAAQIKAGKIDLETPLSRWFTSSEVEQEPRALVSKWLNAVNPEGYGTAYEAFAHGDGLYATKFAQISCPFLALTGDGDANSTPEMSCKMSAKVTNGRFVIIEGHRHMVNLTAPDQVNTHLLEWLKLPENKEMAS
jgi:pimeloyl-ACP methyl ester carboxylesterase